MYQFQSTTILALFLISGVAAFGVSSSTTRVSKWPFFVGKPKERYLTSVFVYDKRNENEGVIELADNDDDENDDVSQTESKSEQESATAAPFLSQGEISDDAMNPDLSDPKQTRVIIYIILSLLPVLFLIPLMLGSREFLPAIIPMDELPPVQM